MPANKAKEPLCYSCDKPIPQGSNCYVGFKTIGPGPSDYLCQFWCVECGPEAIDLDGNPARLVDQSKIAPEDRDWKN